MKRIVEDLAKCISAGILRAAGTSGSQRAASGAGRDQPLGAVDAGV